MQASPRRKLLMFIARATMQFGLNFITVIYVWSGSGFMEVLATITAAAARSPSI